MLQYLELGLIFTVLFNISVTVSTLTWFVSYVSTSSGDLHLLENPLVAPNYPLLFLVRIVLVLLKLLGI